MFTKIRTLALACTTLLVAVGLSSASWAQATQFSLAPDSGGQLQIGTGLPLPVGTAGIFTGGMTVGDAGNFPPLLVGPASPPPGVIVQNQSTTMGGSLQVPPGMLSAPAAGSPVPIAVFPTNPAVFQVATSISYAWPNSSATLAPGGAPGIVGVTPVTLSTTINNATIKYNGGTKAFGGPAQFSISAGPGAAGGALPPNGGGIPPVASVWINAFAGAPSTVTMVALAGASNPLGVAQPGASVGAAAGTTMWGPVTAGQGGGVRLVNQGGCCTVGPLGTIPSSVTLAATFPSNMVTISKGFPWATGLISLTAPATPPEQFFASGTDMRVAGVGNISLVSGSLSDRNLSGPNANRGWLSLTLPEPTAALGAAGAFAMLGLCHGLVRRRSR